MEIREPKWYDARYDMCSYPTAAVLNIHGVRIPFCENCLKELKEKLDKFIEVSTGAK